MQNRKFPPIVINTEVKSAHLFVCKRSGFAHQELRDFVKMTLTRVSSYWLCDSNHSVKNVTRVESESPKIVIRVESSYWLESRYHWG